MIGVRTKWIAAAAMCPLLLACDAGRSPPDDLDVPEAPGPATAGNRANGAESIIREDVLAETDSAPAAPKVEAVEVTLDFAEADGEFPAAAKFRLDAFLQEPVIAEGGCIVVRGHTDSRGSDEQNLRVSQRRAELVGDYLAEQGVYRERLRLIALGERRPVAPNAHPDGSDFPEGRARNRRVTLEAQLPGAEGAEPCSAADAPADENAP